MPTDVHNLAQHTPTSIQENCRFLRACRREQVEATPIWLMRQAGRYMAEYRQLREKYSILELIKTPELACEVTLQPMNAFDLDAAIIFADILPPLEGMGLELDFVKGEGPAIYNPVRTADDVAHLRVTPPEESLSFTLEAIKLARAALDGRGLPLIGFSGAPFTLAAYAVEGGGSSNHLKVKSLMMSDPSTWHALMEKLSEVVGHYLLAQARAGAQVLQLFDSWVGQLAPEDYRHCVMPYTRRALDIARGAGVPIIHFGTDTGGMLELLRDAGGDVIGVDWRINLDTAWARLGDQVAVQGNLDPIALFAPWPELQKRAQIVLDQAQGRPGHIFNLGHGILPNTPIDNVKRLVDFVHEYTAR
ncbi:MAG: uroporphyrinogen decarboxylase [Chloroflexota bacterium]